MTLLLLMEIVVMALLLLVQMVLLLVLVVVAVGGGCVVLGDGTASGLVVIVVGGCDGSVRNSSWLEHRKQEWQELSLASCLQFDCFLFIKMCHWTSVRQYEDR